MGWFWTGSQKVSTCSSGTRIAAAMSPQQQQDPLGSGQSSFGSCGQCRGWLKISTSRESVLAVEVLGCPAPHQMKRSAFREPRSRGGARSSAAVTWYGPLIGSGMAPRG